MTLGEKKRQETKGQLNEPLYDVIIPESRHELLYVEIKEYLGRIKTAFQRTRREQKERESLFQLLDYNEFISLMLAVLILAVRVGGLGMVHSVVHGVFEGKSEQLLFVSLSLLDISIGVCLMGVLMFKAVSPRIRMILVKAYFVASYFCTALIVYTLYLDVPHFFNGFLFCFDLIRGAGIMWVYMLALRISSCSFLENILPYCVYACALLCFRVLLSTISSVSEMSERLQSWINEEYVNAIRLGRFQHRANQKLKISLENDISRTLKCIASLLMLLLLLYSVYVHWSRWVNKRIRLKAKPRTSIGEKEKLQKNQLLTKMVSASMVAIFSLYLAFYNILSVQRGLVSGVKTSSPLAKVLMQFIE